MEENKKEIGIDMNKMIIKVFNKIALWNNQENVTAEDKTVMLKVLAHDIVSDVLSTAFSQLDGVKTREQFYQGELKREKRGGFLSTIFKKKAR